MDKDKQHTILQTQVIALVFMSTVMTFISAFLLIRSKHVGIMLSDDAAAWVQAVGAIIAIASGFYIANRQNKTQQNYIINEKNNLANAAYLISHEATQTLIERLGEAIFENRPQNKHLLQGGRATEIISSMKDFNASNLPASMLPGFISLRGHLFAINERISIVLKDDDSVSVDHTKEDVGNARRESLDSAVRVSIRAVDIFNNLSVEHNKIKGSCKKIDVPYKLTLYQNKVVEMDKIEEALL